MKLEALDVFEPTSSQNTYCCHISTQLSKCANDVKYIKYRAFFRAINTFPDLNL